MGADAVRLPSPRCKRLMLLALCVLGPRSPEPTRRRRRRRRRHHRTNPWPKWCCPPWAPAIRSPQKDRSMRRPSPRGPLTPPRRRARLTRLEKQIASVPTELARRRWHESGPGPPGPLLDDGGRHRLRGGTTPFARHRRGGELRPLPAVPGARRTTYFASTSQAGIGQAITMRTGVYVDLLSLFSGATGNQQPITPASAERVAKAQYIAMLAAPGSRDPRARAKPGVSSNSVIWAILVVVVLGAAVATPMLLRRRGRPEPGQRSEQDRLGVQGRHAHREDS